VHGVAALVQSAARRCAERARQQAQITYVRLAISLHMSVRMKKSLLLALFASLFALGACVTGGEPVSNEPSDDELADLDAWATAADGKADLPQAWNAVVAWLRDVYTNRMSAIWHNQEHPATPRAALDRIRGLVASAGIRDATAVTYKVTVQKLVAEVDHSEVDIELPGGTVIRLVGDPKGAGAFVDNGLFESTVGPHLCLTWSELETAINASYVAGAYGANYVCHTVTERVLRSLGVGTLVYASKYRTYLAARFVWGPTLPTFNSLDPSDWAVSRSCQ
jgi:hypothetical protein